MGLWVTSRIDSAHVGMLQRPSIVDALGRLPAKPCAVIVPTHRQVEFVLRTWARSVGTGEPPIIETMAAFVRRLGMHLLPGEPVVMREDSVDVLIARIVAESSMLRSIGFEAQKLVRWKQYGVTSAIVGQRAEQAGLHTRKGRMLAEIAEAWSRLDEVYGRSACDRGTYESYVIQAASRLADNPIRNASGDAITSCIMIATHGVSTLDRDLLATLASIGWDVGIGFASEFDTPVVDDAVSASATDAAWFVSRGWHHGQTLEMLPTCEIQLAVLPTRDEEIRRVIASIKEDVAQGIALRDIAICVPGATIYKQIVDDVARRAQMPLEIARDLPLATTPDATVLRAIFDVMLGQWQREQLLRLINHVRVKGHVRNLSDLAQVARMERIRGGSGPADWMQRFDEVVERCAQEIELLGESSKALDVKTLERRKSMSERAAGALNALAQIVPTMSDEQITPAAFAALLDSIMKKLGIVSAELSERTSTYTAIGERHNISRSNIREHVEYWWKLVVGAGSASKIEYGSGVAVVSPAELRCKAWQRIYVVGMVEGEFPRVQEHVADRELIPGVLERMYLQAITDIMFAIAEGGDIVFTRPSHIDDAATVASSLLSMVPHRFISPSDVFQKNARVLLYEHEVQHDPPVPYRQEQIVDLKSAVIPEIEQIVVHEMDKRYSPSRIDKMAKCPYAFYAEKILRIGSIDIPEARLSPLERGTMLHDVAAEFFRQQQGDRDYSAITSANDVLAMCVPLQAGKVSTYWQMLQTIAIERMGMQEWTHAYAAAERQALLGSSARPGLLRQWLSQEIAYQETTKHVPAVFELEMNVDITLSSGNDSIVIPVTARVDRIDVARHDTGLTFIVNDYKPRVKSGYSLTDIIRGSLSQMPIYLESARVWFGDRGIEAKPWGAVYRSFGVDLHSIDEPQNRMVMKEPAFEIPKGSAGVIVPGWKGETKTFAEQSLATQIEQSLRALCNVIDNMSAGIYPVLPSGTACQRCDFLELCRVHEWGEHE